MRSSDVPMRSSEQRTSPSLRRSLSQSRDFYTDERSERPSERPSQRSSRSPRRTASHNSGFFSSQSGPNPEEEDAARFLFHQLHFMADKLDRYIKNTVF